MNVVGEEKFEPAGVEGGKVAGADAAETAGCTTSSIHGGGSDRDFEYGALVAGLRASIPISSFADTVDLHNPPPLPRFRPLEPTRLTCDARAANGVREHTVHVLAKIGCVIHDEQPWHLVAEVYVQFAATRFAVSMFRDAEGRTVVEWMKVEGCTLAFCDTYRAFARECTHSEELQARDESGFADTDKSYAEQQNLSPLVLPTDESAREETLAPVKAMLNSEWSTSQREGCCVVATLSELATNTEQLVASHTLPLLAKHLQSSDRHTVRCAAAAIANLAKGVSLLGAPERVKSQFADVLPTLTNAALDARCKQTQYECGRARREVLALTSPSLTS